MTYLVVCFCNPHHFVILMIERCFASIYSLEIARLGRFVSSYTTYSLLKKTEEIPTYVKGRVGGKGKSESTGEYAGEECILIMLH